VTGSFAKQAVGFVRDFVAFARASHRCRCPFCDRIVRAQNGRIVALAL